MNFKTILVVAQRETQRIFQNKDLRLMCFIAPILYGIVLTSTYYKGRLTEIPLGVIDQDQTQFSKQFTRNLDATENIKMSSRFENAEQAHEAILNGEVEGFVLIPRNFSNKIKSGLDTTAFVSVSSSNFMISTPVIISFSDVVAAMGGDSLEFALNKKGVNWEKSKISKDIITLKTDIAFNPGLNYSNFIIPSLLFAILQQVMMVALAFTFVEEREEGKLPELLKVSQNNIPTLMIGKSMPYFVLNLFMSLIFCYTLLPAFGLFPQSHFLTLFLTCFIFVFAVTSWGLFISTFFKTTTSAMIALMFYSMPTFLFSGVSWPSSAMNLFIKTLRIFFPSTYFLSDIRSMVLANVSPYYFLQNDFIMIIFAILSTTLTFITLKKWFQKNP